MLMAITAAVPSTRSSGGPPPHRSDEVLPRCGDQQRKAEHGKVAQPAKDDQVLVMRLAEGDTGIQHKLIAGHAFGHRHMDPPAKKSKCSATTSAYTGGEDGWTFGRSKV